MGRPLTYFVFGVLVVSAALAFGLSFVSWPSAEPASCVYRALDGRYCDEFPSDANLSVMGAKWEALSSLVMVVGALLGVWVNYVCIAGDKQIRIKYWASTACNIFFLAMGIASFEYHRAHCRTWWRLDINLVRAFPFILAETLLFASVPARQGLSFPAISFVFPGLFCAVGLIFLWDDTTSSAGLIAFGALLFYSALALSFLAFGLNLEYIWALGLTFTIGGLFIVMQTESWSCAAHPVAIGHTIFAFYPAIFALAIASSSSGSKFEKV